MTDQPEFKMHYVGPDAQPNPTPQDDSMPGDTGAANYGPAGTLTRVRDYKGYKLNRTNPHGFWTIIGLEHLGRFTEQKECQKAIDLHLDKQKGVE